MARLSRLCVPGWPHLLMQRGHNGQPICIDDDDRQLFRSLLQDAATQFGVQVHAYALRDDELRLLATPPVADGFSQLMQAIGRGYVARYNRRHGRRGALWDGRFRTTVIEPEQHLLSCMQFVEEPPIGTDPGQALAPWSSRGHHLGARVDALITEPAQFWALGNTPFEREATYRKLCEQALTERQAADISAALNAGWALGTPAFRSELEAATNRRLAPLPRGRPRKHEK